MTNNNFLGRLLTLQQDGQQAISGPSNWLKEPVLQVQTSLNIIVDELESSVIPNSDQGCGRWHFFVGSPGNGKSAGAGLLVRRLRERGHTIRVRGSRQELDKLGPSEVPYLLEVCEPGQDYPYLLIAQDASVLPDPYDPAADPALALEELLVVGAARGVSLVVCTNRGVIERAFANGYLNSKKNKESWFKAIKMAVGTDVPGTIVVGDAGEKHVFSRVSVGVTSLDRRSLMLSDDTFDRLLGEATSPANWSVCEECPSQRLCPFKANRDWIVDPELREKLRTLLLHAELYDGQVVVLREALAIVSLLLAGCPHDYETGSPCEWVHSRIAKGEIFSLASRRIYMLLFSSYSPLGLEPDPRDQKAQLEALKAIYLGSQKAGSSATRAVASILNRGTWPSSDVGAQRMLGQGRTFAALDPVADTLPADFMDRWNESWLALDEGGSWISDIERQCFACWGELQQAAAACSDAVPSSYRWLTRWITAFTLRAGALVDGVTTFHADLEALVSILDIVDKPSRSQLDVVKQIEATLAKSLYDGDNGIPISSSASLRGQWGETALRPRLLTGASSEDATAAQLSFGADKRTRIVLETRAFVWLKRRAERAMAPATFPMEYLETARDAMLRVAVTSGYDMQDEIEIEISRTTGSSIRICRSHGGLSVDFV